MKFKLLSMCVALAAAWSGVAQADCATPVGVVMELTGPAGQYGQGGSKAVELAFHDLNAGLSGDACALKAEIRDSQSQGAVGVDAAKQLVDIQHVKAIVGAMISSVTLPVLTAVSVPSNVVQISPSSSTPTLTEMGRKGQTKGLFFRTITSDALQGVAAASLADSMKYRKVAVLYVNNDYGVNLQKMFAQAFTTIGGTVTASPYNERQASYDAEVSKALATKPDALYLIGYPTDAAVVARAWISGGGTRNLLLNDGLDDDSFVKAVGAKYLQNAYGTSSGTVSSKSTDYFRSEFPKFSNMNATLPGADRAYDAAAILGLAITMAGKSDSIAIRDAMHKVLDPNGTVIGAGPAELKRGIDLLKQNKPIRYVGVIGPVQFDQYGDITGPFVSWKIAEGEKRVVGEIPLERINSLKAKAGL